jgi:hypothetical protein
MAPIKRSRWRTLRFKTGTTYTKAQGNPNPELFLLYFSLASVRAQVTKQQFSRLSSRGILPVSQHIEHTGDHRDPQGVGCDAGEPSRAADSVQGWKK